MSLHTFPKILAWSPDGYTRLNNDSNQSTGFVYPYNLDGYGPVSATFTSTPVNVGTVDDYQFVFSCPATGSPNITIKLQGCNDMARQASDPDSNLVNWFDLYFTPSAGGSPANTWTLSGASSLDLQEVKCTYPWMRMVCTINSGSVIATAKLFCKERR
jgi:hypothetical protein